MNTTKKPYDDGSPYLALYDPKHIDIPDAQLIRYNKLMGWNGPVYTDIRVEGLMLHILIEGKYKQYTGNRYVSICIPLRGAIYSPNQKQYTKNRPEVKGESIEWSKINSNTQNIIERHYLEVWRVITEPISGIDVLHYTKSERGIKIPSNIKVSRVKGVEELYKGKGYILDFLDSIDVLGYPLYMVCGELSKHYKGNKYSIREVRSLEGLRVMSEYSFDKLEISFRIIADQRYRKLNNLT